MQYRFIVDTDPEDPDFHSIFLDNGEGASAEIAGRIGEIAAAELFRDGLAALSQEAIRRMFKIKD